MGLQSDSLHYGTETCLMAHAMLNLVHKPCMSHVAGAINDWVIGVFDMSRVP